MVKVFTWAYLENALGLCALKGLRTLQTFSEHRHCVYVGIILQSCQFLDHMASNNMSKSTIFSDITPCSPLKVNRRFGGTYCLRLQGRRLSRARNQLCSAFHLLSHRFLACLIFRKIEATCSSETSVHFQRTTQHYIAEHWTLHNRRSEDLKSWIIRLQYLERRNPSLWFVPFLICTWLHL
jgi:hypothetical protein